MVLQGERLAVPPPEQLPGCGSGGGAPPGLGRYVSLMQRCWASPEERPTFDQMVPELRWGVGGPPSRLPCLPWVGGGLRGARASAALAGGAAAWPAR